MPVFEYQCKQCGERFEMFVRARSSAQPISCPNCNSTEVEKALSLFGLKGGGVGSSDASCGSGPV
ncbi:MAG: zinc ribbon domain-containing protein [Anaerolineales bacterium]|nr:zinc ribbon domain-containing protein [Anaerolineales bacterium]